MVTLLRYANIVIVKSDIQAVHKALYEQLSVQSPSYWFSTAYKEGRWDGYFRLYNQRRKLFPSGLLPQALDILKHLDIQYTIIDKRTHPNPTLDIISNIELRPYQQRVLEQVLAEEQGIIWLPVNAGKTYIALQLIAERQIPTLWVTHRKELALQTGERIKKHLNIEPGLIGMGYNTIRPITIAMIQTLTQRAQTSREFIREINQTFGQLIVDECHHIARNKYYDALLKLSMYYRYGLSGTPKHRNIVDVYYTQALFGPIIAHMQQKELIQLGVSVEPWVYMIQLPASVSSTAEYSEVYDDVIINNSKRSEYIARFAVAYVNENKQVLILVDRIQHGKNLLELLQQYIPHVAFISGQESPETRKTVLDEFERGNIKILIATNILNEGVSLHSIDVIIIAGTGKSAATTIQRVGRALRTRIGKDKAIIIDFWDLDRKYLTHHATQRYKIYKREFNNVVVLDQYGNEVVM